MHYSPPTKPEPCFWYVMVYFRSEDNSFLSPSDNIESVEATCIVSLLPSVHPAITLCPSTLSP